MKLEGLPRHASTHAAGVVIGDRRARRAGAALPRSALGHAGHPVRHEICRGGGAGEVRLPRPQDAVGAQGRPARCSPSTASRSISTRSPGTIPRSTNCSSAATRSACSSSNPKACGARWRRCGRPASATSSRWSRSTGPGPMDNIPMFGDRKNGRAPIAYPHPMLEEVLKETYGIFVYQEQVMQAAQVLAGYSLGEADLLRRAMGKKIQTEMDAQRSRFVEGCAANDISPGQGQRTVRLDRQVRRLRLQQEPRRRLCAGRLPDRLAEGAPSGRILRRLDELRHGADRQARLLRRRHAPRRGRLPAARHQRQRRRFLGRGRSRSATRSARSRASARKRWRRWSPSARPTAPSPASTISPRGSIRACSTAASSKASPAAARSTAIAPDRAAVFAAAETILAHAASAADARDERAGRPVRRRRQPTSRRSACRATRPGRWPSAWPPRRKRSASISPPIRSMRYRHLARRAQGAQLRRAGRAAGAGRRRPHRRDDGRPGRGSALAHLGARAAAT